MDNTRLRLWVALPFSHGARASVPAHTLFGDLPKWGRSTFVWWCEQ